MNKIQVIDIAHYRLFNKPHVDINQCIEVNLPLDLTTPVVDYIPCLSMRDSVVREMLSASGQVFRAFYSYKTDQLLVSYGNILYVVHVLVNSNTTTICIGNSFFYTTTHSSFIEDKYIDYYVDIVDGKISLYYEHDELIGIINGPEQTNNVLLMTIICMGNSNVYIKCDTLKCLGIQLHEVSSISGR